MVKFSIYLNRRVFIMNNSKTTTQENSSYVICEQQRIRTACTYTQSDRNCGLSIRSKETNVFTDRKQRTGSAQTDLGLGCTHMSGCTFSHRKAHLVWDTNEAIRISDLILDKAVTNNRNDSVHHKTDKAQIITAADDSLIIFAYIREN